MYGYIFLAENSKSGKKSVGYNRSVNFDPKYIGEDPDFLADADKTGRSFITTRMLQPCESEKNLLACYEAFSNKYSESVASEKPESEKPKRRRRKSEDE